MIPDPQCLWGGPEGSGSLLASPLITLQQLHASRCAVVTYEGQHGLYFFPWYITWLFQEKIQGSCEVLKAEQKPKWEFPCALTTRSCYSGPDCRVWGKASSPTMRLTGPILFLTFLHEIQKDLVSCNHLGIWHWKPCIFPGIYDIGWWHPPPLLSSCVKQQL